MTHFYKHQLVQFMNGGDPFWVIKKVWYNDHNKPYKIERTDGMDGLIHTEAIMEKRIYFEDHNWKDIK